MPIVSEPKIDCHCHVLDPGRFPYRADTPYRPAGQEIAPVDHLLRMMDLHGVRQALLVGTNSGYGEDSAPVMDALARGEGRFKGIAVVRNDIGSAELGKLKAAGVIGVAFNTPFHGTGYYAQANDLLRRLADLDMVLNIQVREDQILDLMPLIERSDVRLVVDHCGRPSPQRGLEQPGFKALLDLGRAGRASVKLSGLSQFSAERFPWADAHPFIAALVEAFTPDGMVWGSDWPFLRAAERIDTWPLLQLLESLLPDEPSRRRVLWHTPRRLFGFSAPA